ncbi:hypothetical protein QZJ86_15135 [Methylomonas montana]|uniref:hypothetical protein n=1 Tax=Methylomonas montana TaxID=3058963 RepID=UPI002658D113|nr:hypothetical protein [Methylomonas montana]WKJ89346.1 hypothetical protein QZJ86_15135 [Methylomonas montana]
MLNKTLQILLLIVTTQTANAATIAFDNAISGATSFSFDGDGDSINDVIFSTTDPSGFNTAGPGPNQSYINEPGLEGTTSLNPDLRVDFLNGAVNTFQFGFAMLLGTGLVDGVTFNVFDASNLLLATTNVLSDFTLPNGTNPSSFPEGLVSLSFSGIASYATFDFSQNQAPRYIIDNFQGTFGSTENITPSVPEPSVLFLMVIGFAGIRIASKRGNNLR